MKKITTFALCCLLGVLSLSAQSLRAFPGAEGYGAYTTGGRGGRVVYVTHTMDTLDTNAPQYQGSLRQALAEQGPVTIVFKCGGVITLKRSGGGSIGQLKSSRSNVTIAGQTALGDGIVVKGFGLGFSGQNVIIRHMRMRPGDGDDLNGGQSCLWFENGGQFIIDHCSFSWAPEESNTIYDNDLSTVQYCLVSESLYSSIHKKGNRGYGSQWGGKRATYHHNLLAHHMSRMPRQNGARSNTDNVVMFDYRNNVHYNWGNDGAFHGGDVEPSRGGVSVSCNIVNNYYIPGPSTTTTANNQCFVSPSGSSAYAKWHLSGNVMKGNPGKTENQLSGVRGSDAANFYTATEFSIPSNYAVSSMTSAEAAYQDVLEKVGATPWQRDSIDRRVVREVSTETYTYRGSVSTNTAKNKGIIDTQWDIMPAGEDTMTWNPWYSHYRTVTLKPAPGNVDTFLVKTFVRGEWKVQEVKMSRVVDTDGDGIPDWWEQANGLNPNNPADRNSLHSSLYTMLEMYLNGFPHSSAPQDEVIGEDEEDDEEDDDDDDDDDDEDEPTGIVKSGVQPYLRIYPNPVAVSFSIETILEPKTVEVYNLSGQRVASFPAGAQNTYSVALLRRGVYVVKVVFTNGSFAAQRIVK